MNLAYWCILVAGVLPMLTVAVAKRGGSNYNNAAPREWMETLSGYRRRADYAHRNHFEAFPFFAAAVLVAEQRHGAQGAINALALAFIVIRVAYTGLYLCNRPTLRSISWMLGYLCVIALFGVPSAG